MENPREKPKRHYRGEKEWRRIIERQNESGESISAFCREHGINPSLFSKAASRYAVAPSPRSNRMVEFEELNIEGVTASARGEPQVGNGEICWPGGYRIELTLGEGIVLRIR